MAGKTVLATILLGSLLYGANALPEIDRSLMGSFLGGSGSQRENVMVSFTQGISSVINQINRRNFSSQDEKREALTSAQQSFATRTQSGVQSVLNSMGVQYDTFWISNQMIIPNADSRIVNIVSRIPGVAKIEKEPQMNVNPLDVGEPWEENIGTNRTRFSRQSSGLSWGVQTIRANQVWNSGNKGKGIVVANIDTGVRWSHQTLRNTYRRDYGWFDPYKGSSTPNDQNGHGTHTMGTIVGSNGIGVAPESTWIACKGCDTRSCGGSELLRCGQWIQCPTKPDGSGRDCNKAPNIVSNSWGGGGGQDWYDNVLKSWRAAGIIPVVSIGNSGPNCNTAGSPGDRPQVIGVGSTEKDDTISSFSSLGPATEDGMTKPDIAAPGGNIRSAWYTSDSAYNSISGTSMACPHVSGVVALMKFKNKNLDYEDIYDAITETANTNLGSAKTCGGINGRSFPNNVYGFGRIDALSSVNAV